MVALLLQRLRPIGSFVATLREMVGAWVYDCQQPVFQQCTGEHPMPKDADESLWHHPHVTRVTNGFVLGTKADALGGRTISLMVQCHHCGQILSTLEWRNT